MQGNILANKSAKDRPATDFYPTPLEVTVALLRFLNIPKDKIIWECACGEGHMSRAMENMGYHVVSTELNHESYGEGDVDFLTCKPRSCDWVITNPPFRCSVAFIQRCIDLGKPFALLLKSQYWHAKNKSDIFNSFKPAYVLPLTWRPDFLFGQKGGSPTMECIWVVWGTQPCEYTEYQILSKPIV